MSQYMLNSIIATPIFGTADDDKGNNIHLYVPEGSYVKNGTIDNTYNDIRNLGKIFGKEDKAEEIISDTATAILI